MKINYFILCVLCAIALSSCGRDSALIKGRLIGSAGEKVSLERVVPSGVSTVDSAVVDPKGGFRFRVEMKDRQPTIFNLRVGGDRVPLLVSPGERVKVLSFGDIERGYRVSGSAESALVWQLHTILSDGAATLDSISRLFVLGAPDDLRKEISHTYSDEYYHIKREHIRFIVENSRSLAAVYALYQRLPGDDALFNGDSDFVYYQMVADSVSAYYPDSRYVAALQNEIIAENIRKSWQDPSSFEGKVLSINYPDLDIPNMYGQKVKLSAIAGEVTILDFWSATISESNENNAEMKALWEEFSPRLAIYQVSLDTSKPLWVNAVQEQKLPWTSVCDFRGGASVAAKSYNISDIPANFIIDKEGNIVSRNVFGNELKTKIMELIK